MANKRRPQGDGTIRKRSDGRWEGRIIIGHKKNGSPIFKSVFGKTQKATLKQLHKLIDLYRDVDLTEECRMTLGEWLDKWLDEYMIFTVKESTLDGYRSSIENQIKRFIGDKKIAYLTTADVQKFYNQIKNKGRSSFHRIHGYALSDSVVRGTHMVLHQALDMAVKERLLAIKERQEMYRKKFKRSYSKEWSDYVMVDELGGLILPNYITSAFKHLLKKNELREIRYHDLRHTCASLLLNKGKTNGVTLKDIQVWLGHSDFSTTANTYSHLDANSKVSSLNTLAGVVNL